MYLLGVRLASGDCNNVTQLSTQLDLLLAEYERAAPPAAPADVAAALEVRHATVNERDATVRLLGTMYLVCAYGLCNDTIITEFPYVV